MRFEIYKDGLGWWRWRLRAHDGRTIEQSAETYTYKRDLVRAIRRIPIEVMP